MKTYMILSLMLVGVLLAAVVVAAPADRFKGGTYDGHDQQSYIQTSTDLDLIFSRFNGGACDGYALNTVTNTPVLVQEGRGTIFTMW